MVLILASFPSISSSFVTLTFSPCCDADRFQTQLLAIHVVMLVTCMKYNGVSIHLGLVESFLINTACLDVTKHIINVNIYTPS